MACSLCLAVFQLQITFLAKEAIGQSRIMSEPNPFRYGPTRGELKFWLVASIAGLAFLGYVLWTRGLPAAAPLLELVGLPLIIFGYLGGRSIKRLIRHEHP
jgi:hypothetical protein